MSISGVDYTGYLHTYEAYRIPKGTTVKNSEGEDVILSKEEDQLVLTEESSRQLVKDRKDYGDMLKTQAEMAAEKTQSAATEKYIKDQAKALAVYRALANGDNVPASDESRLMDYDKKLYQAAKMAQAMAQMQKKKAESKESQWDQREEEAHNKKMEKLCEESNEAALAIGTEYHKFYEAQLQNVVEIDSSGVDLSSLKTCNLGGLTGEYIDLSL